MFKYFLAMLLILVCLVVLQRGCKGIGERWQERMDQFREKQKERQDKRHEWWQDRREGNDQGDDGEEISKRKRFFEFKRRHLNDEEKDGQEPDFGSDPVAEHFDGGIPGD